MIIRRNKLRLSDVEVMQLRAGISERIRRGTEWVGHGPRAELTPAEVLALRAGLARQAADYELAQAEVQIQEEISQCLFEQNVHRVGRDEIRERCIFGVGHRGSHVTGSDQ